MSKPLSASKHQTHVLAGATGLLLASASYLWFAIKRATGGYFTYPIDDAYIHLGLARRFVATGTWGLNPGEFASASSSPVWTLLEAGWIGLLGTHELIGLWLAGLSSILVLWVAIRMWCDDAVQAVATSVLLLLVVPLPFLVVLGMEHALQLGLALLIAGLAIRQPLAMGTPALAAVSFFAPLVRYELWFAIAWVCVYLVRQRRFRAMLSVALPALGSTAAFSLWSIWNGGFAIPNSLIMKSVVTHSFFDQLYANVTEGAPVWVLVLLALCLPRREDSPEQDAHRFVFACSAITHLVVARVGWVFRYEAWLIGWGIVAVTPPLVRWWLGAQIERRAALVFAAGIPLGLRATMAFSLAPGHARTTYDGDVVVARYISEHWDDRSVAVHNIGAVSFFSNARILDLAGLGNNEIARLHLERELAGDTVDPLLEEADVDVAITLSSWMSGDPPRTMRPVADLSYLIPDGSRRATNTIYAVGADGHKLATTLQQLSQQVPGRVRVERR